MDIEYLLKRLDSGKHSSVYVFETGSHRFSDIMFPGEDIPCDYCIDGHGNLYANTCYHLGFCYFRVSYSRYTGISVTDIFGTRIFAPSCGVHKPTWGSLLKKHPTRLPKDLEYLPQLSKIVWGRT